MSTLRTNALEGVDAKNSITIVAGAGNITTTNVQEGLNKAVSNYDADNNDIRDSFNIASITDSGDGRHQFAFSNIMTGVDYGSVGSPGVSGFHNVSTKSQAFGTVSSSTITIRSTQTDHTSDDDDGETSFLVFGDLA